MRCIYELILYQQTQIGHKRDESQDASSDITYVSGHEHIIYTDGRVLSQIFYVNIRDPSLLYTKEMYFKCM